MGYNGYQGQLTTQNFDSHKFPARYELFPLIQQDSRTENFQIIKLGIVSPDKTPVYINNKLFEIGETHILELYDMNITSLYFAQDSAKDAIIDYIIITY